MAIGVRRLQVLLQFFIEAVMLSVTDGVTGGVVGILAGIVASELISAIANWPTHLSLSAIAGGILFSAAVGIYFGYCPARKPARIYRSPPI
jgi:macrolide transport system ATP-binding/permease protein